MVSFQVTWLKNGNKIFEYINGRNPPYRNFTIPGAVIDVRTWASSSSSSYCPPPPPSSLCPFIACNPPHPCVCGSSSHHTWLCTFRVPSEQVNRRRSQRAAASGSGVGGFAFWSDRTEPNRPKRTYSPPNQQRVLVVVVVLIVTATPWIDSNTSHGLNHPQLGRVDDETWITSVGGGVVYEFGFQTETKLGFS